MRTNSLKLIGMFFAVFFCITPLFAQKNIQIERKLKGNGIKKELNLTQEQQDQIARLRLDNQKKAIDIRSEIQKNKLQMKEIFMNKNIDGDKILSLTKKNSDLQSELKTNRVSTWLKIYNLLDDKQKETFRKNAPMLREGRGKMMKMNIQRRFGAGRHGEMQDNMDDNF